MLVWDDVCEQPPRHRSRGQKTTCGRRFSPSTMLVRSSDWTQMVGLMAGTPKLTEASCQARYLSCVSLIFLASHIEKKWGSGRSSNSAIVTELAAKQDFKSQCLWNTTNARLTPVNWRTGKTSLQSSAVSNIYNDFTLQGEPLSEKERSSLRKQLKFLSLTISINLHTMLY